MSQRLIVALLIVCLLLIVFICWQLYSDELQPTVIQTGRFVHYMAERVDNIPDMPTDTPMRVVARIVRNATAPLVEEPAPSTIDLAGLRRPERAEQYWSGLQTHANDSQNVHDEQIIACHKRRYARLIELTAPMMTAPAGSELRGEELRAAIVEATLRELAVAARAGPDGRAVDDLLETIRRAEAMISFGVPPVKEDEVLARVWYRINMPDNVGGAADMTTVLLQQLHDMRRLYGTVCVNGRISRILSCLTLMDADATLAEPERDKAELHNEAYTKAAQILKTAQERDPVGARLYSDLDAPRDEVEAEQLTKFEESVKKQIEDILRADYKDLIDDDELTEIIDKAKGGV